MPWSPVSPPGSPPEEVPGEVLVSEKADKEDPGGEERLPGPGTLEEADGGSLQVRAPW